MEMSQEPDLKSIRQSKGLTLDDIARRTKIRSNFLEAIEEGNYHLLPERYYVETFIKVYAETLGVDSAPFLARYRQTLEKPAVAARKESQPDVKTEPKKHRNRPALTKKHRRWIGWALSIAVILTLLVFILYPRETVVEVPPPPVPAVKPAGAPEKETPPQEEPLKSESVEKAGSSQQEKSDVIQQPETRKEPTGAAEEPKKKYTLRVEAKELTWLRIREDKEAARQYLLKPGEKLSRQAAERFEIDIGNAGGVELYLQGKPLGSPGKSGEVLRLVLPEQ